MSGKRPHLLPLLSLPLLLSKGIIGTEIKIKNPYYFSLFVDNVNSGFNFSGTTVILDSDLSFPEETLEPIGNNSSYYFLGTFDGQGHIISNLEINSTSPTNTGLFGYSKGLTIRNVVLDSSCSITNSFSSSSNVYVGGIIGYCQSNSGYCNIENSVNMADVAFDGDIGNHNLYLGGIAGHLNSFHYAIYVKNCANYGPVTYSGSSKNSYIGGIVGDFSGSLYKYTYNCLNYGTITHSGKTSGTLNLGNIVGYSYYTYIENCVSAGKISTPTTGPESHIGSIVGAIFSSTDIHYCYCTSELNEYEMYEYNTPTSSSYTLSYDNATFELSGNVSVGSYTGTSLIDVLNVAIDYYILRDYSNWLSNKEEKNVKFTINSRTNPIQTNANIVLLPSLATEGLLCFDGWYTDSGCSTPLKIFEVTKDTKLHGKFNENNNYYIITFDTRRDGISVAPITARFGTVVSLPNESTRSCCDVAFWEAEDEDYVGFNLIMPAHNFTLYAVWKCTRITTPEDFVDFSRIVNSGTADYSGTTVFLDSDLSLSGKTLEPIGNYNKYFLGTFDGQGHIISDLKISSSSQYAGLFGYSKGLTTRNVVLDSSCSITNSISGSSNVYVGGIIGSCQSDKGACKFENTANMAGVTFSGNNTGSYASLYVGGVVGHLQSTLRLFFYVKNCANYGPVTHLGTNKNSYIGGIGGYFWGYAYGYIYNCLNYGTITHNGKTSGTLGLGNIIGYGYYTYIENCVSAGKISTPTIGLESYIGSIVGVIFSSTDIHYCYYTSELSEYRTSGCGTPKTSSYTLSYDNATFELSENVSVGSYTGASLIDALNAAIDYYILRDYSNWLSNKEEKSVKFAINSRTNPIQTNANIILLPSLATEGLLCFDGWYTDSGCSTPLEIFEVTKDTKLHGKFKENANSYIITFDTRRDGISVAPITAQFGTIVSLPNVPTEGYCSIAFWETDYGDNVGFNLVMPAHNFTLYAVWKCTHIATPEDFVDFAKAVNSGTVDYSGTTVFLDSDLSLSGKTLEPIYEFLNVFDGQGYIISDLKMNSSSQYTGLFGYSSGLAIRNLVLDSSCSFSNSYNSYSVYTGSFIGRCYSSSGQYSIENNVNMADVTFSGNTGSNSLYLGGIAGYIHSKSHTFYMKNCVNYGSVTHSGTSKDSYIGGITGYLKDTYYKYLQNCLDHGAISYSGTTTNMLCIGGIAGHSYFAYIENCVSAGKISTQNTPSTSHIGSIVGYIKSDTNINSCYYTGDVGQNSTYGFGKPTYTTNTPNSSTVVDSTLISILNDKISLGNAWNRWLLNANNAYVTFKISDNRGLSLLSSVIVLPSLADGWRNFAGWYTSSSFETNFFDSSVSGNTALYGRWDKYIVAFDANGGTVSDTSRVVTYGNTYGELPTPTMVGYAFNGWFTSKIGGSEVTSSTTLTNPSDHAIYAQWTICSYTLTFVFDNGIPPEVRILPFGTAIEYPEDPVRKGYKFTGWDKSDTSMPARDITITAKWERKSNKAKLSIIVGVPVSIAVVLAIFAAIGLFVSPRARRYSSKNGDKYVLINDNANGMQSELSNYASDENYCYSTMNIIGETEPKVIVENRQGVLISLYPQNYVRPSMRDGLLAAGLTEDHADLICSACNIASQRVLKEGKLFDGFTLDDAAAIAMYTYDFGPRDFEHNPYRIINKSLAERNYSNLQRASGLLYLVMTALRKLPRYTGKVLYRGVRGELNLDNEHYTSGNIVTWSALSSTSPSMDATKKFLAKESKSGQAVGTLFIIDGGWGYSIQPYSLFPGEVEILLEPERLFRVTGVIEADLTIINLKMLDTPLSIPDVFGYGERKDN